jgi:hypothetical protein
MEGDMTLPVLDAVRFQIQKSPGRTQRQIAEDVFGPDADPSRVNWECDHLVRHRDVERHGDGSPADPFTYHPAKADA